MNFFSFFKSTKLLRDSATLALASMGVIASIIGIAGFSLNDVINGWVARLSVVFIAVIVLWAVILLFKIHSVNNGITLKIRGITVVVRQGNIFEANGWKVIGFNEYFDTQVDDKIISKTSLNGQLILEHVNDIKEFKRIIAADESSPLCKRKCCTSNGKVRYPLGCIKIYRDYMLLALTHFNEHNEGHISNSDYEQCLRAMWSEISRTYNDKPVFLPLLGGGVTRIDGVSEKLKFDLLKCMLCTLRASSVHINKPITILLAEDVMRELNLYELKGV